MAAPSFVEDEEKRDMSGGPDVAITIQIGQSTEDPNRVYKLSEAIQNGMRYQRAIISQTAGATSWFSLYELVKVKPPDNYLDTEKPSAISFATVDETIDLIEKLLTSCGYAVKRRSGHWKNAVYLDVNKMTIDIGHMASLAFAEHEWEVSVMDYRTDARETAEEGGRYKVVEDDYYTPQTKPRHLPSLQEVSQYADEGEPTMITPVKKNAEFCGYRVSELDV